MDSPPKRQKLKAAKTIRKRGARAGELQVTAAHTGRIGARYTHRQLRAVPTGVPEELTNHAKQQYSSGD